MSLWLPNAQPNKQLLRTLALGVLAAHFLLMGAYAFFTRPKPLIVKISRSFNHTNVAVRVLPFVRQTGQLQRALQAQNTPTQTLTRSHAQATPTTRVTRQVSKQSITRVTKKTHTQVSTSIQASKARVKKLVKQQSRDSKKTQKIRKSEPLVRAQELAPSQPPVRQEKIQETPPIETTQESSPEPTIEPTGPLNIAITNTSEEIVLGTEEYDALQAYQLIQSEMNTYWHPPAGFVPKRACIILITLNSRGTVTQIQVEQSSGIRAYDMAARMAINRALFPKGAWDQQVRLHF